MDAPRIAEIAAKARTEGRDALNDLEGLRVLEAMAVDRPFHRFVRDAAEAAEAARDGRLAGAPGAPARAVVKVVSPKILHKTEVGGVAILDNLGSAVADCVAAMAAKFAGQEVEGFTVNEFVSYEPRLGHEMIVGYRFARDFGPVVSFGPGGIHAEYLATAFKPGAANVFFSPANADRELVRRVLAGSAVGVLAAGGLRNTKPAIGLDRVVDTVMRFLEAAPWLAAAGITEFEVNPFVIFRRPGAAEASLVALDVLAKLGDTGRPAGSPEAATAELVILPGAASAGAAGSDAAGAAIPPRVVNRLQEERPVAKIDRLLRPRSAAVIGVSEKGLNNGRVILRNLLHDGFDPSRIFVVKAGLAEIDGCRCVPDAASLPEKVDLFVLTVPAAQAPLVIAEIAERDKAESVIVIPGGLEEKEGTGELVARMRAALEASRGKPGGGPLLNGGNCLGIRSVPGRYNTLFIPAHKLPMPAGEVAPVAVISQSGAFAIARVSKHPALNPRYIVTCGNQMDLTVGDYLERLEADPSLRLFAVYVEGFKPLDGAKLLAAVRRITRSGRDLLFYRAGRTAAGAKASASHTASIAGDWPVTRELLRQAGAVVLETLEDFDDALTTFSLLSGKRAPSRAGAPRLGAVSNAGFECVAFADNLGGMELASFAPGTGPRLERIFAETRISEIVDVHNPIDLTPMAPDAAYEETFRAVMEDPGVDAGIVGIVPLTGAMNTLAAGPSSQGEDVSREDALPARYGRLMAETDKPWVAVVDSGALYDTLTRGLEAHGVPAFRAADRALRMLGLWLEAARGRR